MFQYSYQQYCTYIINYCKKNNIKIFNYELYYFIIENKLKPLNIGGEAQIFIDKDKKYVYKCYDIYRNYCSIQNSEYYMYDLISKQNILNLEYKQYYDVTFVACNKISELNIILIYKQPYVQHLTRNIDKYLLQYKINDFFKLNEYQISTYKNNRDIFIIKNNNVFADIGKHNITLKNNEIFIYDMVVYKLDKKCLNDLI